MWKRIGFDNFDKMLLKKEEGSSNTGRCATGMSREYIARDPRTGRPINVGGSRRKSRKRDVEEGPWMAIPQQAVIPLAKGEIETYRVGWKEKDYHMKQLDGIKALSILSGVMAHEAHKKELTRL